MQSTNTDFIFGIRAITEAIRSEKEIDRILIKKGLSGDLSRELFELIRTLNIPFQYVPSEKLDRITRKNHQGIIAYISAVEYSNIEELMPALFESGKIPLILILDGITDVRNFGAIARSAECAGVHAIIIPEKGAAQVNADAVKTSAGALLRIPICRVRRLSESLKFLKNSGLQVLAATEKGADYYYKVDMTLPTAIIMGAEDTGVYVENLKLADKNIKIPILGEIESLNVSVAASLIIYEAVRQRFDNLKFIFDEI